MTERVEGSFDPNEEGTVLVVVRRQGVYRWYASERDLWVLDWTTWQKEFRDAGYSVPDIQPSDRLGILIVNATTSDEFLDKMQRFEVKKEGLAKLLAREYPSARSWWDVLHLFPIMFVDFDEKRVAAFYSEGTPMERYVPDGWVGEFIDFAENLPPSEKYWVQGGVNVLQRLIEAGKESSKRKGGPSD